MHYFHWSTVNCIQKLRYLGQRSEYEIIWVSGHIMGNYSPIAKYKDKEEKTTLES